MKTKRKATARKTAELRIRIIPQCPEPLDDGNMQFYCLFPRRGFSDMLSTAKTAKRAKEILEDFLRNELDGYGGNLEDLT